MGCYTEVKIIVEFNTDTIAENFKNAVEKIKNGDLSDVEEGHFSVNLLQLDASSVEIDLSSDRTPNAEWQCKQIFALAKKNFISDMLSFDADIIVPENLIYWTPEDGEDEDE